MRSVLVVSLLTCLPATLGCRSEMAESSESSESTDPPIGAWVVIDQRTGLFEAPNPEARRILGKEAKETPLRVVEVVGLVGDFIEVRTISAHPTVPCGTSWDIQWDFELHFFVEREALQPVLIRPKVVHEGDGTGFVLMPGVPVVSGGIRVGGTTLDVAIDPDEIGSWFWSSPNQVIGSGSFWEPRRVLHHGEHTVVAESDPLLEFHERELADDRELLTFVNTCGRFVLRAGHEVEVDPERPFRGEGVLGVMVPTKPLRCRPLDRHAKAGTELHWPGGNEAGVLVHGRELPRDAEERDGWACFEALDFDVCIESAKLERDGDPNCKEELL